MGVRKVLPDSRECGLYYRVARLCVGTSVAVPQVTFETLRPDQKVTAEAQRAQKARKGY